ncbi:MULTISPECIES: zinc ribbon domain-containing protein [Aerosakkonema]|uniref:zinc ribbon domain-containing protein n=1 Tax=Aerosakkonema TaxID=1246629 RepID=UPI0035B81887
MIHSINSQFVEFFSFLQTNVTEASDGVRGGQPNGRYGFSYRKNWGYVYFQKVDSRKTSQICPSCVVETGKKELSERTHVCSNCGYTTDRDVAAAQVVLIRGLAAVGQTVKMLGFG